MKSPRKPSVSFLRETKFAESITHLKHKPNAIIVSTLDARMFSMDGNVVFKYKPEVLASKEYERCLSLLERRIPQAYKKTTSQALQNLQMISPPVYDNIILKEANNKEELEQLAVDTIRDMFDIPEHVRLLPEISDMDSVEQQDDSPSPVLSLSPERQREMRSEIEKRVILNGLVHGCAMHIWKSAHYIIKDKVDAIDQSLMEMYNIYTASIGWLLWQTSPLSAMASIDKDGLTQGQNELKFEEEGEAGCDIECSGVNFPVLLHEVAKGAIDYLICHAIPKEYTEEELTYYYAKADDYKNEFWHYLLSPTLWTSLIEAANIQSQELPQVIVRLTQLDYKQLTEVMKACIDGAEHGDEKLRKFKII